MATSGCKSHQSWEKIVKVQMETSPEKTSRKGYMMNWGRMQESLLSCVAFHLLMVLRHNSWVR
jgi:hypothetical protein